MNRDLVRGMALNTATLRITPEMLLLIAEIDEFKSAWRAIAPERLSGLRRVATIESIGSSTTRDEQDVDGYAELIEMVFNVYDAIPLTENHIRQLHCDLLAYSTKDERHRGSYKMLPNHVEAFDAEGKSLGVVFETATPFHTPRRMAELVEWLAGRRTGTFIRCWSSRSSWWCSWKSTPPRTATAASHAS